VRHLERLIHIDSLTIHRAVVVLINNTVTLTKVAGSVIF
jgi:hypothetical protein